MILGGPAIKIGGEAIKLGMKFGGAIFNTMNNVVMGEYCIKEVIRVKDSLRTKRINPNTRIGDVKHRVINDNIGKTEIHEKSTNPNERVSDRNHREINNNNKNNEIQHKHINPNERIGDIKHNEITKKNNTDVSQKQLNLFERIRNKDYFTTYQERISFTPAKGGNWIDKHGYNGKRGESLFISENKKINNELRRYGLKGIEYKNGNPDFSKVSICTVKIDNMSSSRYGRGGNFEQAFEKTAQRWTRENKFGIKEWSSRDVEQWCIKNGYTVHERSDMKTCDIVKKEINGTFSHSGGVAECKRRDNIKGVFDE